MATAQLVIKLSPDNLNQLARDGLDQDRRSSDTEKGFLEQGWEVIPQWSDYGYSQINSDPATESVGSVGTTSKITGDTGSGTNWEGDVDSSHAIACPHDLVDDLPSIRSETGTLTDHKDEDERRSYDGHLVEGPSEPYDDLPSIRSLPDDIANESRPVSNYYLGKHRNLDDLPSIRSEASTLSRNEGEINFLSDDTCTLADVTINGHYDDLPSIHSETRALTEDGYSLIDDAQGLPTDPMSSWATLTSSGQSTGVTRADGPLLSDIPMSLDADIHDHGVPTGTGVVNTLQRCSKALLNAIEGIGCGKWRKIKYVILGSLCAAEAQGR